MSKVVTIKEYDQGNRFSIAGTLFYSYNNISPEITSLIYGYLGEYGAGLWIDKKFGFVEQIAVLTPDDFMELQEAAMMDHTEFKAKYFSKELVRVCLVAKETPELFPGVKTDIDTTDWMVSF